MTTIKVWRDDNAVTSLKNQNSAPETAEGVGQVHGYPTVEPSIVEGRLPLRRKLDQARKRRDAERREKQSRQARRSDRRSGRDRRKKKRTVLLDTRSNHERRTRLRRQTDWREEEDTSPSDGRPKRGFDEFV